MRFGIAPIGWANDDIRAWGSHYSGDRIMDEIAACGYQGSERSYTYPEDPGRLREELAQRGLELCGAYRWTNLADSARHAEELALARAHVDYCAAAGARHAIVAEGVGSLHWDFRGPRDRVVPLDEPGWARLTEGLRHLAAYASDRGVTLGYHAHAGTAVERRPEIDELLHRVEELAFCLDTAQLALAGEDPEEAARDYADRIPYAHLKDVRPRVLDRVHLDRPRFLDAVRWNVFCTPGQGGLDFRAILPHLRRAEWLVVEADQDPAQNPPLEVASRALSFLKEVLACPA
ncbi:MAG: sugar phosphate isomerase/epimerase [Candidatus Eremiobacterota bacterium]